MNWFRRIFGSNTLSGNLENDKDSNPGLLSKNQAPSESIQELADQIAKGSASISVFPSTQEANALAQAHLHMAYSLDSSCGVKMYLLKSKASKESGQFLLIKTGTKESLRSMYDEFKKGLSDKLLEALSPEEASAINPVVAYHNYSLPGMDLLPGDHLKPFRDAISNNEYEYVQVHVPENVLQVVSDWKEKQFMTANKKEDAEKTLSTALINSENEARTSKSVPVRKIYIHPIEGDPVIAWSSFDDGSEFDSKRARNILTKHLEPLGYEVTGPFIGSDKQDRRCTCHYFWINELKK